MPQTPHWTLANFQREPRSCRTSQVPRPVLDLLTRGLQWPLLRRASQTPVLDLLAEGPRQKKILEQPPRTTWFNPTLGQSTCTEVADNPDMAKRFFGEIRNSITATTAHGPLHGQPSTTRMRTSKVNGQLGKLLDYIATSGLDGRCSCREPWRGHGCEQ